MNTVPQFCDVLVLVYFTSHVKLFSAGYMRPEIGLNFQEHFQYQHHHVHSYQPPSSHPFPPHPPHPHYPPLAHYPPHPHDLHEAIQREKEQIKHEIIMSEIARRTVLEAEVRRELMMERELALRRGSEGFPFGPSLGMGLETRLPLLGTKVDGSSHEERITLSTEERERMNPIRESNGFETLSFQRGAADLRVSEVKPILEGGKGKEKVILLAKPGANISGSKRKPTPPGVDACKLPSDVISNKKAKLEWSCALCHVSAHNEKDLNGHLNGKKHKSQEAKLKAQRTGKNYSIGLLPKKTTKSISMVNHGTEDEVKKASESLQFKSEVVEQVQKKKESYKFWCEMCKVGTASKKAMDFHKMGKKHVKRLHSKGEKDITTKNIEAGNETEAKDAVIGL